jgi:hypothetical protein
MLTPHPVVGLVTQEVGFDIKINAQSEVDRDQYLQRENLAPASACRALQSHAHSERWAEP